MIRVQKLHLPWFRPAGIPWLKDLPWFTLMMWSLQLHFIYSNWIVIDKDNIWLEYKACAWTYAFNLISSAKFLRNKFKVGQRKHRSRLEVKCYNLFEAISDLDILTGTLERDRNALLKPLHQIQQKLLWTIKAGFKSFPLYSSAQEIKSVCRQCYERLFALHSPPPFFFNIKRVLISVLGTKSNI